MDITTTNFTGSLDEPAAPISAEAEAAAKLAADEVADNLAKANLAAFIVKTNARLAAEAR